MLEFGINNDVGLYIESPCFVSYFHFPTASGKRKRRRPREVHIGHVIDISNNCSNGATRHFRALYFPVGFLSIDLIASTCQEGGHPPSTRTLSPGSDCHAAGDHVLPVSVQATACRPTIHRPYTQPSACGLSQISEPCSTQYRRKCMYSGTIITPPEWATRAELSPSKACWYILSR